MAEFVIGIDIGTSGLKTVLMDGGGEVLAEAAQEYPTAHPHPGWAEQSPDAWWEALKATVRKVLLDAGATGAPIAGISVSSMAPVLVPLDVRGRPLMAGMIWADKRAEAESAWMAAQIGDARINQVTANHPDAYYLAPKCLWLRRHHPELFAQTHQFVTASGYINFRLTGRYAIDHSHLPLTLMADVHTMDWSESLLTELGLPREKFPAFRSSLDVLGELSREAAEELGMPAGAPVLAGTVDTAAALVGMGVVRPGQAFVSMGTGTNVGTCLEGPAFNPSLVCVPHAVPGLWLVIGVMTSTGASLKWFRDKVFAAGPEAAGGGTEDVYERMTAEAAGSPAGSGGLIFLPYLMGEQSPIWDVDARGVYVGISPSTSRADLMRAIMEGCAYGIRHNFEVFHSAGWETGEVRIQGGAAKSALWNQIISDVVGQAVLVPPVSAGAPVGNAILAGLVAGLYHDLEDAVAACAAPRATYHPNPAEVAAYDCLYPIYLDLYGRLRGSFSALAAFRKRDTA